MRYLLLDAAPSYTIPGKHKLEMMTLTLDWISRNRGGGKTLIRTSVVDTPDRCDKRYHCLEIQNDSRPDEQMKKNGDLIVVGLT